MCVEHRFLSVVSLPTVVVGTVTLKALVSLPLSRVAMLLRSSREEEKFIQL